MNYQLQPCQPGYKHIQFNVILMYTAEEVNTRGEKILMVNSLTVYIVNNIRTILASLLRQHSEDYQYRQSEHFGKETILFYWFLRN